MSAVMDKPAKPEKPVEPAAAVKTPPPTQEAGDPVEQYKMPRPCEGMAVLFFKYGTKDQPRPPEIAFVIKPGGRAITLRAASGVYLDGVRHVNDPKLAISSDLRAEGAWDFTDEHYRMERLEKEVAELKTLLK